MKNINWISIEDNLPENNDITVVKGKDVSQELLIYTRNGKVSNTFRVLGSVNKKWKWLYSEDDDDITHYCVFIEPRIKF